MVLVKQDNLYKGSPYKPLLEPKNSRPDATITGVLLLGIAVAVTSAIIGWWIFFGTKTACRRKWSVWNMTPTVALIWLWLIYADGERRYIIAPQGISVGDTLKAAIAPPFVPAMPNHCLAFGGH